MHERLVKIMLLSPVKVCLQINPPGFCGGGKLIPRWHIMKWGRYEHKSIAVYEYTYLRLWWYIVCTHIGCDTLEGSRTRKARKRERWHQFQLFIFYFFYHVVSDLFYPFYFFRLAAHNTAEHQVHVDKRWRCFNGLRGDRGPADTYIVDQRLRSAEL